MKLAKRMIKDLPHKWMFSPYTQDVVVIDSNNSNFREGSGCYNTRCKVQFSGARRYIRYQNAFWYID